MGSAHSIGRTGLETIVANFVAHATTFNFNDRVPQAIELTKQEYAEVSSSLESNPDDTPDLGSDVIRYAMLILRDDVRPFNFDGLAPTVRALFRLKEVLLLRVVHSRPFK